MRPSLRSRTAVLLAAVAAVLVVAVVSFLVVHRRSDPAPSSGSSGEISARFTVDGRELFIECRGSGSPTVILDAGLGDGHRAWDRVRRAAAMPKVRTCAYDRSGVGDSPQSGGPRAGSITGASADLRALLEAAGVPPPYVLVAHSIAGLIHRYYTKQFPDQVAGLVMLDTAPDDWDLYNERSTFVSGGESLDVAEAAGALRASDDLGARPVIVVQAARTSEISGAPGFPDYWRAAQRALAADSTNSILVVAANSNHGIPASQPDLVAGAVAVVVQAAQTGEALPPCASSPLPALAATC